VAFVPGVEPECDDSDGTRTSTAVAAYRAEVARRPRRELPDGVYHVVSRGVAGTRVFRDAADRRRFLSLFADVIRRFDWHCYAFCLMGTHYHLVAAATRPNLSAGLHRLNGVYAQAFNQRHERRGHLFGHRFSAWVIEGDDYFANTCEYVLQNPVRAGLCETAEDWPWSGSYYRRPDAMRCSSERAFGS
jgi:REP element-mobilizing transposase RayT